MTTSSIRRATLADARDVERVTVEAYAKYVPVLGRKPQPMTADAAGLIAEHSVWLLSIDGRLAGVLVLKDEPDALLVYSLAIAPGHQAQGHGTRLLAWAEDQARASGAIRVRLYTNELMGQNVAWYAAHGYSETGREPYLGSMLVHMAKVLTP